MPKPFLKTRVAFSSTLKCIVSLSLSPDSTSFTITVSTDDGKDKKDTYKNEDSDMTAWRGNSPPSLLKNNLLHQGTKSNTLSSTMAKSDTTGNVTLNSKSNSKPFNSKSTTTKIESLEYDSNNLSKKIAPRQKSDSSLASNSAVGELIIDNMIPKQNADISKKDLWKHPSTDDRTNSHPSKKLKKHQSSESSLNERIEAFLSAQSAPNGVEASANNTINTSESESKSKSKLPKLSSISTINTKKSQSPETTNNSSLRPLESQKNQTPPLENISVNPITQFKNIIESSLNEKNHRSQHDGSTFLCKISKEEAKKVTWKYKSISFIQLYNLFWDAIQSRSFEYVFSSTTSPFATDLKHDDATLPEKMEKLPHERPQDADLLILNIYTKKTLPYTRKLYFILTVEKKDPSIQETLKKISMKFSSTGEKTLDLSQWKSYLGASKSNRDKTIMYATLLFGRVRDVTPRIMRKAYDRFKTLIHILLHLSLESEISNRVRKLDEELHFFNNFKKKDRTIALIISAWLIFESDNRRYESALELIGEIFSYSNPSQQLSFIYLSKARMEYNNPDLQLVDYTRCIDLFPIFSVAFVNRADLYYRYFKDGDKALLDLEQGIRLDPSWSVLYCNRGVVYKDLFQNYTMALSDYNIAISCDTKNGTAFLNRGLLYCTLKRYHMALVDFDRCISIVGKNPHYLYNRGFVHHILKNYDKALNDYGESIGMNPGIPEVHFQRALIYMEQGDLDAACEGFSTSIQLRKTFSMAYYYRGQIYLQQRNYFEAISNFNSAVQYGGSNVKIILGRGRCLEESGDYNNAIKDYNTCLLLSPNYSEALQRKQKLESIMAQQASEVDAHNNSTTLAIDPMFQNLGPSTRLDHVSIKSL